MVRSLLLIALALATGLPAAAQTSHFPRWKAGLKRATNQSQLIEVCTANGFLLRDIPDCNECYSNGTSFGMGAYYKSYDVLATLYHGKADTANYVGIRPNSEIDADDIAIKVLYIHEKIVCIYLRYVITFDKRDTTFETNRYIWPGKDGLEDYNMSFGSTLTRLDIEQSLKKTHDRFGIILDDFEGTLQFEEYLLLKEAILKNDFQIVANLLAIPNWGSRTFGNVGVESFRSNGRSIPKLTEAILKEYWHMNPYFDFHAGCIVHTQNRWAESGHLFKWMLQCLPH
jgi:hypothetical protein